MNKRIYKEYVNNVAIKANTVSEWQSPLPAGKSTILKVCYPRKTLTYSDVEQINEVELYFKNLKDEHEFQVAFTGMTEDIQIND